MANTYPLFSVKFKLVEESDNKSIEKKEGDLVASSKSLKPTKKRGRRPGLSKEAKAVLSIMKVHPEKRYHGYQLGKEANLAKGSIYRILRVLRDKELLIVAGSKSQKGFPPQMLYQLSDKGIAFKFE